MDGQPVNPCGLHGCTLCPVFRPFHTIRSPGKGPLRERWLHDSDPHFPSKQGQYIIHSLEGHGTFGHVFKAVFLYDDDTYEDNVALKIVDLSKYDPASQSKRMAQVEQETTGQCIDELRAARLAGDPIQPYSPQHPNLLEVYESFTFRTFFVLATQWMRGAVRSSLVTVGRPIADDGLVATIAYDVLKALAKMHKLGLVHRDVKCANILLECRKFAPTDMDVARLRAAQSGTVAALKRRFEYITDFCDRTGSPVSLETPANLEDVDRWVEEDIASVEAAVANGGVIEEVNFRLGDFGSCYHSLRFNLPMYAPMHAAGTPAWWAPEVASHFCSTVDGVTPDGGISGAEMGSGVDVWGLGCCVVEMVTSVAPYTGLDMNKYHAHDRMRQFIYYLASKDFVPPSVDPRAFPHVLRTLDSDGECGDDSRPKVHPQLVAFANRCLTANPERRPTAAELLNDPLFQPGGLVDQYKIITRVEKRRDAETYKLHALANRPLESFDPEDSFDMWLQTVKSNVERRADTLQYAHMLDSCIYREPSGAREFRATLVNSLVG